MGGIQAFYEVSVLPGLYEIPDQYIEVERVQPAVGLSGSDSVGFPAQSRGECKNEAENPAGTLYAELYLSYRALRYRENSLIRYRPFEPVLGTSTDFMTMPEAFRTIYIASGIWQGAGWGSIMYTAALSNASQELKEAAVIDGANIFQQIKAVEWPA